MVAIMSSGANTGGLPSGAAAKGGVEGAPGGGSAAVAHGDDERDVAVGRRSAIA